jgi:hypothetical protein
MFSLVTLFQDAGIITFSVPGATLQSVSGVAIL